MKKLLTVLFCFVGLLTNAQADNSIPGTYLHPTSGIKPAITPNQILITKDLYSANRFDYEPILFDIVNDSLRFTKDIKIDLSGLGGGINGNGATNYLPKWTGLSALGNSLIYDDGAKIGIGTSSPAALLSNSSSSMGDNYAGVYGGGFIWNTGNLNVGYTAGIRNERNGGFGLLILGVPDFDVNGRLLTVGNSNAGNTIRFIVKGDGKVGIGTASPSEKLSIIGGNLRVSNLGNQTFLKSNNGVLEAGSLSELISDLSTNSGLWLANGTTSYRPSGKVGIGTDSPFATLSNSSSSMSDNYSGVYSGGFIWNTGNLNVGYAAGIRNERDGGFGLLIQGVPDFDVNGRLLTVGNSNAGNTIRFIIKGDGKIGIGTAGPSQKLHVSGNARITGAIYDSNNSPGTANQILSTTGTATNWVDFVNLYSTDGFLTGNRTINSTGQSLTYLAINGSNVNSSSFDDSGNDFGITDGVNTSNLSHRPEHLKLTSSPFKIVSENLNQLLLTDNESNFSTKSAGITTLHYNNNEEPFAWAITQSGNVFNTLRLGGGNSNSNAATAIDFYTATNNTTTTGSRRMQVDQNGNVAIGNHLATEKLDVDGIILSDNIPTPPSSDGTYTLQVVISSGVAIYSWQ